MRYRVHKSSQISLQQKGEMNILRRRAYGHKVIRTFLKSICGARVPHIQLVILLKSVSIIRTEKTNSIFAVYYFMFGSMSPMQISTKLLAECGAP